MKHRDNSNQIDIPRPYCRAAIFAPENIKKEIFSAVQNLVYEDDDLSRHLSVYQFVINRDWCIVILGDTPSSSLKEKIETYLSKGQDCTLPDDLLSFLWLRRLVKKGPWEERHYWPE
jgi:hypothetical protein